MTRLTKRKNHYGDYTINEEAFSLGEDEYQCCINALGWYEDFEDTLDVNLITLFKALENGFYYIKNNEIKFCRWCVRVGKYLVEVKPCYAVKETTIQSCYYGNVSELKQVNDAHYWEWNSSLYVKLKNYGKTWALTRRELENGK